MPCSHYLSHCSFHLGLIWQIVFKHENGYHQTELLAFHPESSRIKGGLGGSGRGLPPLGFPHHHPFSFTKKRRIWKNEERTKSLDLSPLLSAHLHDPPPQGGILEGGAGGAQIEEGREPTDASTPLAIIKIHSSGLCLHLPCTD